MTSQIILLNKKRSFVLSDSASVLDDFKSYVGEEKVFKLSDKLSTVVLVSGNGRFCGENLKNHVVKYLNQQDVDELKTVNEIKDTFNNCIANSCKKIHVEEYISDKFPEFVNYLKKVDAGSVRNFLEMNSTDKKIEELDNNKLLDNYLSNLVCSLDLDIGDKCLLKRSFYDFLVKSSTNLVLVGYDENNNYPTLFKYSILYNDFDGLIIVEEYSLNNYYGTMIFGIAQNQDIYLNLLGVNEKSKGYIKKVVFELFDQFMENCDDETLKAIEESLETKLMDFGLKNMKTIIDYIEFLSDEEILKLLETLIELTSVKKKFSDEPHSVGGNIIKGMLRKYDGVQFIK